MTFHKITDRRTYKLSLALTLLLASSLSLAEVTLKTLHNFSSFPFGVNPNSALVEDSAGNLYGYAAGGAYGVIFKLSRGSGGAWSETVVHNFTCGSDGEYPVGALNLDASGNIYGATKAGGTYGGGTVFKLSPSGAFWKETILHSFPIGFTDGNTPVGVVVDGTGKLYGSASFGGKSYCYKYDNEDWLGCGVLFELTPKSGGSWAETILHNFQGGDDGGGPLSPPILNASGNLYGTTFNGGDGGDCYSGGTGGCGLLYQFSKRSNGLWVETVLYNFPLNQIGLVNSLALDSKGNLYGFYGGYVVQYTPSPAGNWNQNILLYLTAGTNGTPVFDAAGNLYGVTAPATSPGTIFKLTPKHSGRWAETTLYTFTGGSDGAEPNTPKLDSAGNIFVAAKSGGMSCPTSNYRQCGTIFELSPSTGGTWTGTTLYEFPDDPPDGLSPSGGLIADSSGNLYGSTSNGGAYGDGAVYQLVPEKNGTWSKTLLHSFAGADAGDGSSPVGNLIFDGEGNLYGSTRTGGTNGGTVFKLSPSSNGSWTESILYSFSVAKRSTDGNTPTSGLTFDGAGNLYGTTGGGGSNNCGTVFKLVPSSSGPWIETQLYSFSNSYLYGCDPYYQGYSASAVVFDGQGNLYGTDDVAGTGYGLVYELSPPTGSGTQWTETSLYTFSGEQDGEQPEGGVVFDSEGNLYGTVAYGAAYFLGQVYKLTPSSGGGWMKTDIHYFSGIDGDGAVPWAAPVIDAYGNLYDTTTEGGISGCYEYCGTAFELSPSGNGYQETILANLLRLPRKRFLHPATAGFQRQSLRHYCYGRKRRLRHRL